MDSLNLTPDQIASKIRKGKAAKMDIFPTLTGFYGRIGRSQFLAWYVPIWIL